MASIWYVDLDRVPLDAAERWLSPAECERLGRFRSAAARNAWLRSRVALRHLLGEVVGCAPGKLQFIEGAYGKPRLLLPGRQPGPHLSLSRSGGLCAIALSREAPLGIDIERLRPMPHADRLAPGFLPPDVLARLLALPAGQRDAAFLATWTRMEALAKATGLGLQWPLAELYAATTSEGGAGQRPRGAAGPAPRLITLRPDERHVGALACREGVVDVAHWSVPATILGVTASGGPLAAPPPAARDAAIAPGGTGG